MASCVMAKQAKERQMVLRASLRLCPRMALIPVLCLSWHLPLIPEADLSPHLCSPLCWLLRQWRPPGSRRCGLACLGGQPPLMSVDLSPPPPCALSSGSGTPHGRAAVGWRVSVDSPRDDDFVNGFVVGQDGGTLKVCA